VTELMPEEPEALGLLALMLHADARRPARRTSHGAYVPLAEQDMTLWDLAMIDEAEALLHKASARHTLGRFQLEAALQSAHVHRRMTGRANWDDVLTLYDALLALSGSPVVGINRALALAEVQGAAAAIAALDGLASDARLAQYQPFWAARAEFLARTGDRAGARHAYDIAIGLERDPAVRRYLQERQARLLDS
jgi:RNA polymerase sigma-70 factor (ECF subfamily)